MEAKELMIGDWVYYGTCKSNMGGDYDVVFEAKQLTINDFKFFADNDWNDNDFEEFLQPIPLTKEILEKNGFNFINYEYPAFYLEGIELMEIENMSGGLYELKLIICIRNVYLHYVHELQHALRLCGINKEIEL